MTDDTGEEATEKRDEDSEEGGAAKDAKKVPKRESLLRRIEHNWLEIFAAALLALATIMSAFSAYQAALWDGRESHSYSAATSNGIEASELQDKGNQQVAIDVDMLTNYLTELWNGNTRLAKTLMDKGFSPELKTAFAKWAADQAAGKQTARNPMLMPEYKNPNLVKAKKMEVLSRAKAAEAGKQNDNANNYIMLTVLFASVLFFAGIGTKFKSKGLRIFMLGMGTLFFCVSIVILSVVP